MFTIYINQFWDEALSQFPEDEIPRDQHTSYKNPNKMKRTCIL